MRTIGFPELLVLLGLFVVMLPVALISYVVCRVVKRSGNTIGSKACGHCGQRIPDVGTFCPVCGQKAAAG